MAKANNHRRQQHEKSKYWKTVLIKAPDRPSPNGVAPESTPEPDCSQTSKDEALTPNMKPTPANQTQDRTECKPNNTPSWKKWIEVGTLAAGISVAIIYSLQLNAMLDSNKINRESLQAVQRAFISVRSNIETNRTKRDGQMYWNMAPFVENDGNTPAIDVVQRYTVTEGPIADLKEDIFKSGVSTDPDGNPVLPAKLIQTTVAPKATQGMEVAPLKESYIFGTELGEHFERFPMVQAKDVSVFGWIVYRDVMEGTKTHLTEFCKSLVSTELIPQNPPTIRFNFNQCAVHNCTDEYCRDYAEIVSYAETEMIR